MPVALITGSGKKRVGSVVAQYLAERGWDIAVHYRSSVTEAAELAQVLTKKGIRCQTFQADLADEQAVQVMVDQVFAHFGQVDLLVNAAAIWERKPLEEVTGADVRKHFDTNCLGTFLTCQQVGMRMTKQPQGGLIVNIGDWAEARPYLDYAAYFPSKGAVSTLSRCFAVELAARNPRVRVNCLLPGPVMLPEDLPTDEREEAIAGTLVKAEGSPENIAQAVESLWQNKFITGVSLPIDGGRTICSNE